MRQQVGLGLEARLRAGPQVGARAEVRLVVAPEVLVGLAAVPVGAAECGAAEWGTSAKRSTSCQL